MNFNYSKEEIYGYIIAINKILDNLDFYKINCRKRIENYFTIDKMVQNMEQELTNIYLNPNEEKIKTGKYLSKNISILKELITYFFISSKLDYEYLANKFNEENVHKNDIFNNEGKKNKKIKKKMYKKIKKNNKRLFYEKTMEYKIKHPIVMLLRKIGIYDDLKKILRFGVNNIW